MMNVFPEAKKNFGFGCMCLPMKDGEGKGGKASECIKCGKCEHACPQHLPIRRLLTDVAATFERK